VRCGRNMNRQVRDRGAAMRLTERTRELSVKRLESNAPSVVNPVVDEEWMRPDNGINHN